MRHITKQEETCGSCQHIKVHEDWYDTCDYCGVKINEKHEDIFEWNIINGKDDYRTEEPMFDKLECALKWLVRDYPKYAKTHEQEDSFYTLNYLHPKHMKHLRKILKMTFGARSHE